VKNSGRVRKWTGDVPLTGESKVDKGMTGVDANAICWNAKHVEMNTTFVALSPFVSHCWALLSIRADTSGQPPSICSGPLEMPLLVQACFSSSVNERCSL
jgi:hypothetical protein